MDLRPLTFQDRFRLFSLYSNPKITLPAGFKPLTQKQVDDFLIETAQRTDQKFLAVMLDHQLIGVVGCDFLSQDSGTLNYLIDQPYWGKGYASKACELFLVQLKKAGFRTLYADCFSDNPASFRVLEKLGFQYVQDFQREYPDLVGLQHCRLYMKKL